jgi:hypothetical protein
MNSQYKTVLLTILTLSVFTIALVELSGVSSRALFNKFNIGDGGAHTHKGDGLSDSEADVRHKKAMAMPKTIIQFDDAKHSFGKIKEGDVVKHAYHFKNTGNAPLLISRATATCGCTVPSFPREPIPPGGEGDIVVRFDSHNRKGHQQKNVLISSNAQLEDMSIGFDAEVE